MNGCTKIDEKRLKIAGVDWLVEDVMSVSAF
jgi:hypothetical protein